MKKRGFSNTLFYFIIIVMLVLMLSGCHGRKVRGDFECGGPTVRCIEIENLNDYPEYTFYYLGTRIFPEDFIKITGLTDVYKLEGAINVYAVDQSIAEYIDEYGSYPNTHIETEVISSGEIKINQIKNVFVITSFDVENKKMVLELKK